MTVSLHNVTQGVVLQLGARAGAGPGAGGPYIDTSLSGNTQYCIRTRMRLGIYGQI